MDSLVGKMIAHYRIERELGRGGMGVVYLARDTRLNRAAAIKALPDDVASDRDRLARFKQEAQVLASLSHPNVAGIYGLEESDRRRYLALEYVEGETLAARIARGPLPIGEAVDICLQVAAGMEAAHDGGIIHRDLKPGNVMITSKDVVKVLDFGLAKGTVATDSGPASKDSPTLTGSPATMPGIILGTAAYLSPEQARGKAVDRRTDIWSFGCTLYECLTGRRAFEGETVSDLIAAILSREVEWSRLPRGTPPAIHALLRRCLEKDPRKRLRDIGDARLALEEIREGKTVAGQAIHALGRPSPRVIAFSIVLAIVVAAAGLTLWNILGPGHGAPTASHAVKRFSIALPSEIQCRFIAPSPDGRFLIAYGTPRAKIGEQTPRPRIYSRRIDGSRFEVIEGSEGALNWFCSPDGRWIYYLVRISERGVERRLMKAPMDASAPPVGIMNWDPSWAPIFIPLRNGDLLVVTAGQTGFVRVSASGGEVSAPIRFDAPGFIGTFVFSEALPGDRGILVDTASHEGGGFQLGVGVVDPRTGKAKILLRDGGNAAYASTGHLVFTRRSTLLAVPFDLRRLEIRGEPVAIADGLRCEDGYAHAAFILSTDGTLAHPPGGIVGERRRLIVVDGQGQVSEWSTERTFYRPRIYSESGGGRIAFPLTNPRGIDEIWISERGRPSARRVVVMPGADCAAPAWSPDGKQIAFARTGGDENDGVYLQSLDGGGPPRRICKQTPPAFISQISWSPDGRTLIGSRVITLSTEAEIVRIPVLPALDPLKSAVRVLTIPGSMVGVPSLSPDGRWIAFASNETGRFEVYVASYRPDGSVGTPLKVSSGGGFDPRWSRGGREVFYQSAWQGDRTSDLHVMSVALRFQSALSAAKPVPRWDLDQLRVIPDGYDILPNDQLVAIQKGEAEDEITRVEVVLNFFDELRQKVKAAGKQ